MSAETMSFTHSFLGFIEICGQQVIHLALGHTVANAALIASALSEQQVERSILKPNRRKTAALVHRKRRTNASLDSPFVNMNEIGLNW